MVGRNKGIIPLYKEKEMKKNTTATLIQGANALAKATGRPWEDCMTAVEKALFSYYDKQKKNLLLKRNNASQ